MMRAWAFVLVACILLPGCFGSDEPRAAETVSEEFDDASDAPVEASVSPVGGEAASATPAATAQPEIVPLLFDGIIPAYVTACARIIVGGVCQTAPPPEGDFSDFVFIIESNGNATRISVVLTWTSVSPATDELAIGLLAMGQGEVVGFATGPSPLTLEITTPFTLAASSHALVTVPVQKGSEAAGVGASLAGSPVEQPFSIVGELLIFPAPGP